MTSKEQFMALVDNDTLRPSDAIIVLEGDGLNRYKKAVALFKEKMAKVIVFSGGIKVPEKGSIPHTEIVPLMIAEGIPAEGILVEQHSTNTHEQAKEVVQLAMNKAWKRIILVASHYHQYRAYLTFLKEIMNKQYDLIIYNAAVRELPWFEPTPWGNRFDLLSQEFDKIDQYTSNGHVASFDEGIAYQRMKEKLR
jgi:uncharacterized SAM-binding protein YcdF (DUF218 family)